MNSKHFSWLSIASLVVGIVACFISAIFNLGGGLIWIIGGITSFVSLQFCSAILDNLEKMPNRIEATLERHSFAGNQAMISSEPGSLLIPELDQDARRNAVEKVKTSGFIAAEKVRTKGQYSIGVNSDYSLLAIICPDGKYYTISGNQLKDFFIKTSRDTAGATTGIEVLINTVLGEIHIVLLDYRYIPILSQHETKQEADQIIRLLNKVRK